MHPKIHLKKIIEVSENFQVRFDAVARSYRYVINHGEFSPFLAKYCLFLPKFDTKKLNEILQVFVGKHDFVNFMKSGSGVKSSIREIYYARAYECENLSVISFKANGFLRSQVRLMVANALKSLQSGENLQSEFSLKCITRIPISPNGLYLNRVFY